MNAVTATWKSYPSNVQATGQIFRDGAGVGYIEQISDEEYTAGYTTSNLTDQEFFSQESSSFSKDGFESEDDAIAWVKTISDRHISLVSDEETSAEKAATLTRLEGDYKYILDRHRNRIDALMDRFLDDRALKDSDRLEGALKLQRELNYFIANMDLTELAHKGREIEAAKLV